MTSTQSINPNNELNDGTHKYSGCINAENSLIGQEQADSISQTSTFMEEFKNGHDN
ncbi:hypothetical protein ACIQ34_08515 [Ureibacillus sp. NPDC094379]